MNPYIGHPSQLSGAEEVRLVGGRGDGMRLLRVYNGRGLEITVSLDRCADLSRVIYRGGNCGYFSPCGYVAPAYYDGVGNGFLKSFTAGFLTTCGLNNVGVPCEDAGESLPLHGSIGNTPAEWFCVDETEEAVIVRARISDETIFGRKLTLHRTIELCKNCDEIRLRDRVAAAAVTASHAVHNDQYNRFFHLCIPPKKQIHIWTLFYNIFPHLTMRKM